MTKLAFVDKARVHVKTAVAFTYGLFRWGAPLTELAIVRGDIKKIIQSASYERVYRLLKEEQLSETLQENLTYLMLSLHMRCFGNPPNLKDAVKLERYTDELLSAYDRNFKKCITNETAQMNLVMLRKNRSLGELIDLMRRKHLTHPKVRDAVRDDILRMIKGADKPRATIADIKTVENLVGKWETQQVPGLALVG
ncbi:MAG: hypothetical protein Q7S22_05985 [Candidatus Micrarchaeota archaeon]|nr:hypothetical protein [Candidatus Micrarchaeota archaeon]